MLNVIKDYLISIAMHIDKKSFQEADNAVKKADQTLSKTAKETGKNIAGIAKAGTVLFATMAVALGKMASSVAETDRQMGFLARRLFTTKENARALTIAMKKMHIASLEELREVALDPEAKKQFLELKDLARKLENGNFQKNLKEIRELNFEFRKFMVRFEYLKIEVASNFAKWFKDAYPKILPILNMIKSVTIISVTGWKLILRLFKEMGETPFFKQLGKLLKVLEDLMVYMAGGQSLLAPLWERLGFSRRTRERVTGEKGAIEQDIENEKIAKRASKLIKNSHSYKWGESVGGFRANRLDKNNQPSAQDLVLSTGNVLYLNELGQAMGDVANKFRITSGWEEGHSRKSKHHSGQAMDFGFKGTSLNDRLTLIRAVLNSANTAKALLEVNAQTSNQIYNQLEKEGYKVYRDRKGNPLSAVGSSGAVMYYKYNPAEHLHTEDKPYVERTKAVVMQNTININSPDPKESAVELTRELNLEFDKGGINP